MTLNSGAVVNLGDTGILTLNGGISHTITTFEDVARITGGTLVLGTAAEGTDILHDVNVANIAALPYEMVIDSSIDGDATAHLQKTGDGGLLLNGTNTYQGDTFLVGGTNNVLGIGSDSPFGSGVVSVGVTSLSTEGAARTIHNRLSLDNNFTFGGSASSRLGSLDSYNFGGGWWDIELAGPVTFTAARTITVAYPVTVKITGDVGELYGQQGLLKAGPGFLQIEGSDFQSGALTINSGGGSVILKNHGHLENLSQVNVYDGASLILDDTGIADTDRIDDRIPISLFGGTLQFGNSRTRPSSESVGIVTIGAGIGPGTIRSAAGPGSTARNTIERINPAMTYSFMSFTGGGEPLGSAQNQLKVLANNLPTLSGSAGKGILPWAFIISPDGTTDFVSYDAGVGFTKQTNVVVDPADINAVAADANVVLTDGVTRTLTGNRTINALLLKPALGVPGITVGGAYNLA